MNEQNQLPTEFDLTTEQKAEIEQLVNQLHEKCREFEAPFMVAICLGKTDTGSQVAEASYFNGDRTPDCMALAEAVVDKNITHPLQLLASMQ